MKKIKINCAKRWSELDWNALVRYHSILRGVPPSMGHEGAAVAELMERMQEFEVVSGLEIVGVGVMPIENGENAAEMVTWLEKEIGGMGSCVWMRKKQGGVGRELQQSRNIQDGDEVLVMRKEDFVVAVREATAWMEKKEGLLKLPEKWVVVDGETFALPTLVGNDERVVRYGQYGDMQVYMLGIMGVMNKMDEATGYNELLEQLQMYRNGFLSTLLLPTVKEQVKVDDTSKKDGWSLVEKRKVLRYDRGERERIAEKMDKAPSWLFSMLWHLVQSCLAYYHGRFPDLVSNGKNARGKNTDMYVAKLGTDNAVMKYAGYPNVDAVNNEPIGVILERLDSMAKESKEWEKARRRK